MTTTAFQSPPPFNPGNNNPAALWTEYKDSFIIYAIAAKLASEDHPTQIATFLHILGPSGRRIYDTFDITLPEAEELTLNHVYAAFDTYYEPYKNLVAFRYLFFTTHQGSHQPFAEFLTDLKTKARNCEFGPLRSSLICTQIVCGLKKETTRKELLAKRNLTLDVAIATCQAEEAATQHASAINAQAETQSTTPAILDAIQRRSWRPSTFVPRPPHQQANQAPTTHWTRQRNPSARANPSYTQPLRRESGPRGPASRRSQSNRCPNCDTSHQPDRCPARNAECFQCSRRGHWATCCRARNTHETTYQPTTTWNEHHAPNTVDYMESYHPEPYYDRSLYYDEDAHTPVCNAITLYCHNTKASPSAGDDEWFETIYFANFPVTMKLDTGSQVNIIHTGIYEQFPIKPQLHKPPFIVRAYSGHFIDVIGVIYVRCASFRGPADQCFYVTPHRTVPILGARAAVELGLITRHSKPQPCRRPSISQTTDLLTSNPQTRPEPTYIPPAMPTPEEIDSMTPQAIIHMYRDVFDRIGKLPGKYTIHLKPNASPTICAPRQIPLALRAAVQKELNRLQEFGIITAVTAPTEWVNPMVVVTKPEADANEQGGPTRNSSEPRIRICLDPRNLNAAIKKEPYPTPTAQEIFANLHGAEIFTVFDAQSAFWQVELDEPSSYLCTFATPFGRFRFLRLALGICTSSSVFQRTMHSIYPPSKFPNTHISTDDFLVATKKDTHNRAMVEVLERARQTGLTFSSKKMQLATQKITYLGLAVTPRGLEISPSKIRAIQAIPSPSERTALQRFLGMVNFVARFIPQHSTKAAPLRELLKKDATFLWDANAEATFNQLKRLITTSPALAFFDPKVPSTISVDSSRTGVGAVLLQGQKPVEYASTSFTTTQQNYAPIERELLGILYACERFQYYVIGTNFTVETDHRPLVAIVRKPLHLLSPRLQRLVLKLSRFNLRVVYVPGSHLYIADTLSRAPRPEKDIDISYLEGPYAQVYATTALPGDKIRHYHQITSKDTTAQALLAYTRTGWPTAITKLATPLKPFWPIQDELHEMNGLIYRGDRLYVPEALRKETLQQIHAAHQGISACIARAKQHVYWPQMTSEITEYVKQCTICQRRERANMPLPLRPHSIPDRPWEIIGSDLFHMGRKTFIILVDYFSKYVEAKELRSTNAEAVTQFMSPHFARHGAPQKIMSDNGPPYNSSVFHQFLQQWGVQHVTSSPYHPQSNGLTERTIQTIKNMMIKTGKEGNDLQQILMEYRATPIGDLPSPAEMLMGRQIRTPLTTSTEALRPNFPTEQIRDTLQQRQQTMIKYQRPHRSPNPPILTVGRNVYHYIAPRTWGQGKIVNLAAEPDSYFIQTETGRIIRRTRHQLRLIDHQTGANPIRGTPQEERTEAERKQNTYQDTSVAITYRHNAQHGAGTSRAQDTPITPSPLPEATPPFGPAPQPNNCRQTRPEEPRPIQPSPFPDTTPPFGRAPQLNKYRQARPHRTKKPPQRYGID